MSPTRAITLISDRGYKRPLAVMLRSVDAHVRDASIPIFVLSPDLTEGELSEISPESTHLGDRFGPR